MGAAGGSGELLRRIAADLSDFDKLETGGALTRRCVICGGSLEGHRRDALCCSAACRREASRVRAVLSGESDRPYSCLAQLIERRQRHAKRERGEPMTLAYRAA
jgi:hypothetical protein